MRGIDSALRQNISGADSGLEFTLLGGMYQYNFIGTWGGGSIQLTQLAADYSTWLSVSTLYTANGGDTVYLPPGRYRWSVVTATGVSALIIRVPGE